MRLVATNGQPVAVDSLDVVLIVQRHVLDHPATDADGGEARHRRQRLVRGQVY